jgi:hypothetical protein
MQPVAHDRSEPTQMLPLMPATESRSKTAAPAKKPKTRNEAMRAALARKTRRNSLRKQRDAQKG